MRRVLIVPRKLPCRRTVAHLATPSMHQRFALIRQPEGILGQQHRIASRIVLANVDKDHQVFAATLVAV